MPSWHAVMISTTWLRRLVAVGAPTAMLIAPLVAHGSSSVPPDSSAPPGSEGPSSTVPAPGSSAPTVTASLEGVTWEADPASLGVQGGEDITPTLSLRDGNAFGFAGCNTFISSYELDGTSLTFGPILTTLMACVGPASEVEFEFLRRLEETASFEVGVSGLVLRDAAGADLVQFNVANSLVVGDWTVTGYLREDLSAFVSVVPDVDATVTFADDGTLAGNAGCNTFRGPWTQSDDHTEITVGPLAATRMACIDPEVSAQETSLLHALETSVTADVTTHAATFYNADEQRTVTLTR
jgi:heat shock protein HslJ